MYNMEEIWDMVPGKCPELNCTDHRRCQKIPSTDGFAYQLLP